MLLALDQIRRLYFTNTRIAQVRLQRLYELRVLERFRPRPKAGEGSRPYHWILDEAGALMVADWKGIDRSELRYTRDNGLRIAASRNLAHHVEANEFFIRLALEAGALHGELREWYGVRTLTHMLSGAVVPDGYGVLAMPDAKSRHVLLELDRGTEPLDVLRSKAKRYVEILPRSSLHDHDPFVILATPSERRTRSVRSAVAQQGQAIRRDTSPQQPAQPSPVRDPRGADGTSRALCKHSRSKHSRAAQRHRLEPRDAPLAARHHHTLRI